MRIILVFFLQVTGWVLRSLFKDTSRRSHKRNNFSSLSNIGKVEHLEKRRVQNGYHKNWLYHRCRELGLLKEYNALYKVDNTVKNVPNVEFTKFSFGRYRGQLVKSIWEKDKGYIDFLINNVDSEQFPAEMFVIDQLRYAD